MLFGYLYSKGIIKNGDSLFNLWCWLSFRRWFQMIHIPYHFFMGIRYGYKLKNILKFCWEEFKMNRKTKKANHGRMNKALRDYARNCIDLSLDYINKRSEIQSEIIQELFEAK